MNTRTTGGKRRGTLAALAAVGLVAAGYGTAVGVTPEPATGTDRPASVSSDASAADVSAVDDYESTLKLSDGGQVTVRLVADKGVQERHRAAGATTWSGWKTLYKTATDRCQGVELAETNGTVSLIADFGLYCSDGEPPTESVAGVAQGDLADWDIDITEDFDGWEDTSINDDGSRVLFLYNSDSGLYTLGWEQSEGFGKISKP
ncbi:hypothetical protein [Streptomyces sp. Z26]|uniref:hypothetical protein n=1 Tax=Streptomyces sp. Z26 TaxID=2500177 RepID=UPI001F0C6299|nr:hypothetical protein [Streptomyces sp. Z26]